MNRRALVAAALLAAVVTGCTRPERPAPPPVADATRLLGLAGWEARGRIAVRRDGERPEGGQAGLEWRQGGAVSTVALRGPFGTGGYELESGPGGLTLRTAGGDTVRREPDPAAAERWLTETVGWSFPVGSVRYWLLGVADPARPADAEPDAEGRLARLRQAGWEIAYPEYRATGGFWLPRRLTLTGAEANATVRVRIVIDRWLLDTAGQPTGQ